MTARQGRSEMIEVSISVEGQTGLTWSLWKRWVELDDLRQRGSRKDFKLAHLHDVPGSAL
jgi:hypothetical protein